MGGRDCHAAGTDQARHTKSGENLFHIFFHNSLPSWMNMRYRQDIPIDRENVIGNIYRMSIRFCQGNESYSQKLINADQERCRYGIP